MVGNYIAKWTSATYSTAWNMKSYEIEFTNLWDMF